MLCNVGKVWQFLKKWNKLLFKPEIPLGLHQREMKTCQRKNLYTNVRGSVVPKSQDKETNPVLSVGEHVSKACPALDGPVQEWSTDTCHSLDEPWNTLRESSHTKGSAHIAWFSVHSTVLWTESGEMDRLGAMLKGTGFLLGGKKFWNCDDSCLTEYTNIYWIVHFKWINGIVCELWISKTYQKTIIKGIKDKVPSF